MQRVCQLAKAHGSGKSLKVKKDDGHVLARVGAADDLLVHVEDEVVRAGRGRGEEAVGSGVGGDARDDLDVSVKSSPRAADNPTSWIRRPNLFYLLKTGWMADFSAKTSGWACRCFIGQRRKRRL